MLVGDLVDGSENVGLRDTSLEKMRGNRGGIAVGQGGCLNRVAFLTSVVHGY